MSEKRLFCRVPIKFAINFADKLPFDTYVKLSDTKIIKIDHHDSNLRDRFVDYQKKGLKELYALKSEYDAFVELARKSFSTRFFGPGVVEKFTFDMLDSHYAVLKEMLNTVGVSDTAISMSREISRAAFKCLSDIPKVFRFFKQFVRECDIGFSSNILVAYLSSIVVAEFVWGSTQIQEKMFLAALLSDITLSEDEYIQMRDNRGDPKKLPPNIYQHTERVVEIISGGNSAISQEVVQIVSQHHERPGGIGYPYGLDHQRISILSAVFIISNEFCSAVDFKEFDTYKLNDVMKNLEEKYCNGSFKKAYQALQSVVGFSSSS